MEESECKIQDTGSKTQATGEVFASLEFEVWSLESRGLRMTTCNVQRNQCSAVAGSYVPMLQMLPSGSRTENSRDP
jgi:hypothetical protein